MNSSQATLPATSFFSEERRHRVLEEKTLLGGGESDVFDLFPLKYPWAWELYQKMLANHWEPEDIKMQDDADQWRGSNLSESERWIIRMGIGYFSAAEGIVGDNLLHVIRDKVTAPELKLVLGRHAHEENIHADSLLYMISSLGIDPHQCEAMFEQIPWIRKKNAFVTRVSRHLRRDMDMTRLENQQLFAKNAFLFGQCMEGTQFFGLFAMILSLGLQGKLTGIGQMFRYTLRDETNHISLLRQLLLELVAENPAIWTDAFQEELVDLMREAVALEKEFVRDCLPTSLVQMNAADFSRYIDFIADRRLRGVNLPELNPGVRNPFGWMDEATNISREDNFFERRVADYQKSEVFERKLPWLEPGMNLSTAEATDADSAEILDTSPEDDFDDDILGERQACAIDNPECLSCQ